MGIDCSLLTRLNTHPDTLRPLLVTLGLVRLLIECFPCFPAKGTSAEDGVAFACERWLRQRD